MYEVDPKEYKGAMKISEKIGLSEEEHGSNYCKTHRILDQLKEAGYLEQNKNFGFRYICCNSSKNL